MEENKASTTSMLPAFAAILAVGLGIAAIANALPINNSPPLHPPPAPPPKKKSGISKQQAENNRKVLVNKLKDCYVLAIREKFNYEQLQSSLNNSIFQTSLYKNSPKYVQTYIRGWEKAMNVYHLRPMLTWSYMIPNHPKLVWKDKLEAVFLSESSNELKLETIFLSKNSNELA